MEIENILIWYVMFISVIFLFVLYSADVFASNITGLEIPVFQAWSDDFIQNIFNTFSYVWQSLGFMLQLMLIQSDVQWFMIIFITPAIIIIAYIFITRILIPLINAIGNLIPFT